MLIRNSHAISCTGRARCGRPSSPCHPARLARPGGVTCLARAEALDGRGLHTDTAAVLPAPERAHSGWRGGSPSRTARRRTGHRRTASQGDRHRSGECDRSAPHGRRPHHRRDTSLDRCYPRLPFGLSRRAIMVSASTRRRMVGSKGSRLRLQALQQAGARRDHPGTAPRACAPSATAALRSPPPRILGEGEEDLAISGGARVRALEDLDARRASPASCRATP